MAKSSIDYDAYVKGLGDVPTNQEAIIKKYLDELAEKDDAFKAAYNPDINVLHDCYNFIKEAVSKLHHTGNFIAVEDAVVFKMARDYFIDILPAIDVTPVQETVKEVSEQIEEDAKNDDVKHDEYGFEVFGEETEEPEEAVEEEPCNQEENVVEEVTEKVTEEKAEQPEEEAPIRYDDNGEALLFDFM